VVRTSTVTGEGIDDLWAAIERHREHQDASGRLAEKRRRRVFDEVQSMVAERLRRRVGDLLVEEDGLAEDLAERRLDPYRAAAILLERVGRIRPSEGAARESHA